MRGARLSTSATLPCAALRPAPVLTVLEGVSPTRKRLSSWPLARFSVSPNTTQRRNYDKYIQNDGKSSRGAVHPGVRCRHCGIRS